ncbi:MAG: TonB-dependent receptor plug domain-containing protein, partial [Cellvibrionales bacterium]|nr:TonB-dependent receptor plug domain-containing protein [Cellvibrionales bacterium]
MRHLRNHLWGKPTHVVGFVLLVNVSLKAEEGLEEVEVVSKAKEPTTEMHRKTERLFSVAGAANDPLQAIYALPGVALSSSDGPGSAEPVIRGSAPEDNAYYIDLIPATYLFHMFGNSIFNKYVIKSFDLYPAAFSGEYSNATGGVIDVSLRAPRNQDFTTNLHTSILTAGVLIESGIGETQAFYAAYRRSMMDQFLNEEDLNDEESGFSVDQLPISDDYQVKYQWQASDYSTLSFVAAGASDLLAATFGEGNNLVERDPDFAGPAEIKKQFDSQGLIWQWAAEEKSLTTLVSHIEDKEALTYGVDQYENTTANRVVSRLFYRQPITENHRLRLGLSLENIGYDLDFNAKYNPCSDLDAGDCSTVDADYVRVDDAFSMMAYEVFIEDQWAITEKAMLNLGMNFSNDDYLNEGRVEPRIRAAYQISDEIEAYIAAGQYSQLPKLREMVDVLGNPNLTTIKSTHYVLGMGQHLMNGWRWNTDVYVKSMQDVVVSAEQDSRITNFANGAEGTAIGIEFLLNKQLTDRWYGWAALSLSQTDRTHKATNKTAKFEYDKPILFNLVLNRLVGEKWMLGIKWNYQSGSRYTPIVDLAPSMTSPEVLAPVYGAPYNERYPDYHRLDFRAEYTSPKQWGFWTFYVDILDVYNRKNIEGY